MAKPATLLLCCLLFFSALSAQQSNANDYQLHIKKATGTIKLDGVLDEPDWQGSQSAGHFKLVFPNDTAYSKWGTEVRATFDDQYLYFGAVCRQKNADYTVQSLRRDFEPGSTDVLNVLLGPAKDGLNGMLFAVSPYNVQREALIDNGANLSFEWDNKWHSAVKSDAEEWVVEIAIPFKTLRYSISSGQNSWELQFIRTKIKDFESSVWAPVPFQYSNTNLAFAGRLIWETPPPKPGVNISLIPYAIGGAALDYVRSNQTLRLDHTIAEFSANIGGDAKIAITPGLNLDLTVNPDFSQVEADKQVTNLSRFELFFPETRQFFLENRDLFATFGFPNTRPFFSRRIGLAYNPVSGQNTKVSILAGARLSGKIGDDLRIGLLNMQTREQVWSETNAYPAANFTVATLQQKTFSRSAIGAIFVNRENFLGKLNEQQKSGWQPWNRVAGLEYNLYSKDNRWEGEWYYHRSFSPDKQQRGGSFASFLSYHGRHFEANLGHVWIDSTYSAAVGFVPRPGVQELFPGIKLNFYPKSGWAARHITVYNVGADGDVTLSLKGHQTDHSYSAYAGVGFKDQSYWSVQAYHDYTYLFEAFDPTNLYREGTEPLAIGGYENYGIRSEFTTGTSHDLQGYAFAGYGQFFTGHILSMNGTLTYRVQPVGSFSVAVNYDRIRLPRPYASADLWLIGPRAEISFRRDLFLSAFLQYNTQVNNFNINTRLQWRFAPVSDMFLVYTDNYFAQSIRPDLRVRFMSPKNKALVLKVVYWLNV